MKQLIIGGARSGKSRYAEQLAGETGKRVIYIATAEAGDAEMQARIEQHRQQRDNNWQLVEEPVFLADVLKQNDAGEVCMLVDCLTLWLSNLLCSVDENVFQLQRLKLLEVLPYLKADVLLVSNEVGQGIVPMGELNRRFIDESGRLHQELADTCDKVSWIMAGLPQRLK
ncbi:MAG: bifunctional adenosylcobinamide kinase/adenosylcobinamide-phosphate guanylyltransferase [Gammaproteobacteria bacterium]|nr:bifunctional adenosylcobinamide kinase/adenosylcobinamide-phosphate guanylyltransferase [Gammaproteobacteria bacterium]